MRPKHLSRPKIVAGNWKLNGDRAFVDDYLATFKRSLKQLKLKQGQNLSVLLIPPAIFLPLLSERVKQELNLQSQLSVQLAAQNVAAYASGAYTGEVSASMLNDFSCRWCLVGHSERRALFGESDQVVVEKIAQLLVVGIRPILCLGETLEQREQGQAETCVRDQLQAVLDAFDESALANLVLAYEPVWAIGTGKTASPEQAQAMHQFIRSVLKEKFPVLADSMPILYGGSVNAQNAKELFEQIDIDGALVGGASLKAEEFLEICARCLSQAE